MTPLRPATVAIILLAIAAMIAACGGGGSSSSGTPTGSGSPSASGGAPADALLVIAPPDATHAVLSDAEALDLVHDYFLTSLSQDPASINGVAFSGDDLVWGTQPVPPSANADAFNAAYSDAYGEPPAGVPVATAYDAVYVTALAAAAAKSTDSATIRDDITYVANSPGDIVGYGSDNFAHALEVLATEGGDVNYIGASGQVDLDATGQISKGSAQTWKVINGQIAPIETRDVDLAAEAGAEVPAGELKTGPAAEGPLSIGVLVSDDEAGTALNNAAQLAVDEINAAGGVFQQDVQLVETQIGTPEAGSAAASTLISDSGVSAIIGPASADAVSSALDAVKASSVPLLALSGAPELGALEGGGFLFQMMPSDALQMPVLANLAHEGEVTSVCVVHANGAAEQQLAAAFQEAMQFKNATVRASQGFDAGTTDYKPLLQSCIGS
jgi:ABC-type branched-subunit amino acid transport system substrate-binding protein